MPTESREALDVMIQTFATMEMLIVLQHLPVLTSTELPIAETCAKTQQRAVSTPTVAPLTTELCALVVLAIRAMQSTAVSWWNAHGMKSVVALTSAFETNALIPARAMPNVV